MRANAQAVKVNFRFTEGLRKRLDSLSLKMEVPVSDVVRKAVENFEPDAIQVRPSPEDRKRIDAFCESLGCSPNFILRCALVDFLDKIDLHGFRTSILIPPSTVKEFSYPPKQAVPEVAEQPIDDAKLSDRDRAALDAYRRGPVGVIAAGAPGGEAPVYKIRKKPSKS